MGNNFLLEIGFEEMPARFLNPATEQLKDLAAAALGEQRLAYTELKTYSTPRRLALLVRGLADRQESLLQEVKGPAVKVAFNQAGEPAPAALGFAKSQKVQVKDLKVKTLGTVEYVFAVKEEAGRPVAGVLAEICPRLVEGLHFPRPMRWGHLEVRFARPIRWLVALLGKSIIPFAYAGLTAGRVSYGHRFLSSGPLEIASPDDYQGIMKDNFVLVDPRERRSIIWQQVQSAAAREGGRVEPDDDLLDEVNNLVEYPTALCGSFEEKYLDLPGEVLVTPMREHQRYFPVVGGDHKLLPKFVAVRNGGADYLDIVRAGNEKVLRARLADAAFFWHEDLKIPLAQRVEDLKKVVYQESLGAVYDKVERIKALSSYLAAALGAVPEVVAQTARAARLAKADLVTNMVFEFPELQGVMGREYASRSGEEPAVAEAVFEHYLPRHAGDELPSTLPGRALSLADKLDTLVGCFGIGIQPTGSQDPYALRRQALGVCYIILDAGLDLSLSEALSQTYAGYAGQIKLQVGQEQVAGDLAEFFRQRLRGIFIDRGLAYDTVDASLAAGYDNFSDVWQRAGAVEEFRRDPAFADLITVFTRAHNLSKKAVSSEVRPGLLEDPAERELYDLLVEARQKAEALLAGREYQTALREIAALQQPVARFFDSVLVMAEDARVRENRLALLRQITTFISSVADFDKIVVTQGG
ncbi:MAG: glycine--tRNA ligase subunit beta [Bacillota bacterium]